LDHAQPDSLRKESDAADLQKDDAVATIIRLETPRVGCAGLDRRADGRGLFVFQSWILIGLIALIDFQGKTNGPSQAVRRKETQVLHR
jgi:hypothetical protein